MWAEHKRAQLLRSRPICKTRVLLWQLYTAHVFYYLVGFKERCIVFSVRSREHCN